MQTIKTRLEIATGKKVKVDGQTAKVHVSELDGADLHNLNKICLELKLKPEQMKLKRSGTGITIIVSSID